MSKIIFQLTEDGSHTLYLPEIDEHYHSVHGAIQESHHVYLVAGFGICAAIEPHILEIGFGTGLNTLLTALAAKERGCRVQYTTVERFPLSLEQTSRLNYGQLLGDEALFDKIHEAAWEEWCSLQTTFCLKKINTDFLSMQLPENEYDLIYFDAFAPNKQAEMWQQPIFDKLFYSMKPEGVFVTYCAKGIVRRMLQASGFSVERLPGPPGKHEMLRAQKVVF
jgi:tRNA U34 5-methylaminomethyl-2-thiouridine-forming methyltransferase MnmC